MPPAHLSENCNLLADGATNLFSMETTEILGKVGAAQHCTRRSNVVSLGRSYPLLYTRVQSWPLGLAGVSEVEN